MRRMEEATMPFMPALLLGTPHLLDTFSQRLLAAFLCLVSMRVELSSHDMRAIPASDRNWLRTRFEPPPDWTIWIGRYEGSPRMDERYTAMHVASAPDVPTGVEYCNSQVTTLVIGQLCAHMFSSTVWRNFRGYHGLQCPAIWPPWSYDIEVSHLTVIAEADVPWLHEAIARDLGSAESH